MGGFKRYHLFPMLMSSYTHLYGMVMCVVESEPVTVQEKILPERDFRTVSQSRAYTLKEDPMCELGSGALSHPQDMVLGIGSP